MNGAENAILLLTAGVGLPVDMTWDRTHVLSLDSCIFGDVVAAEWRALLDMPNLRNSHWSGLFRVEKRAVSDIMGDWHFQSHLESDMNAQTVAIG